MRKLGVFNFMTLNGYFKGPGGDISWHQHAQAEDPQGQKEEGEFAGNMAQMGATLLFGRVTYEMMAGYWPTPDAKKNAPQVADGMNKSEKIVFSRTLKKVDWNNSRLVKGDLVEEVRKLKEAAGSDMCILGSGSIVTQLAEAGLIDEYMFMVDPVILGEGEPVCKGMSSKLGLKLKSTRTFKSGTILLTYEPISK